MEGIVANLVEQHHGVRSENEETRVESGVHVDIAETSTASGSGVYDNNYYHSSSRNEANAESSSSYRVRLSVRRRSQEVQEEAWSCLVVLVAFWFFASMTLILGFYGSAKLALGSNYSRLVHANSFFVQEIRVNGNKKPGPMLHGFTQKPPLNVHRTWNETHHILLQANYHQEWMVWLNRGSVINVSYNVKNEDFSSLILVLVEGKTGLNEWIEEPSYPNVSLSWDSIHGIGSIEHKVEKDEEYYIAIGNLNSHSMEVHLNFKFNGILYDTTKAEYTCSLQNDLCGVKLFLLGDSYAILSTPGPKESGERDEWSVRLSYGPRWLTYLVGSGGFTLLIMGIIKFITKLQAGSGESEVRREYLPPERTPLITQKDDDDDSSCGSSYVSVSVGEEDDDELNFPGSPGIEDNDIKSRKNNDIYQRRLCAICFDAPRDSFFLPCGHCVTCSTCGMRISEETNMCPICRKKIRKVKKIFAV
ncbi:E3 ubiquitin-protein ligase APD2 isoform X2 [Cryptomeria japonica]|uniref:E3 ubiquitin-protein ligase APD2 isoform X2 n=1 Tax=Cryptomeria japonica TaxID=3369 RepID=UPI0027D9E07C|nr:E3 ubiquitin-protein ligase APD2 isoform X2 [Cryptomeria japonica]